MCLIVLEGNGNVLIIIRKRLEEACIHQVRRFLGDDVAVLIEVEALPDGKERTQEQRKVLPGVKKTSWG